MLVVSEGGARQGTSCVSTISTDDDHGLPDLSTGCFCEKCSGLVVDDEGNGEGDDEIQ